jgi:hypothetical protein
LNNANGEVSFAELHPWQCDPLGFALT